MRSDRISSVYIVSKLLLWVILLSKLVNFECVGMCWNVLELVGVLVCWSIVGVLLEFVGLFWNVLECVGMCWNVLECVGVLEC